MKYLILTTAFLFSLSSFHHTFSQGCSDAGICNIRSFRPVSNLVSEELKNVFSIGMSAGGADREIMVFGAQAGYSRIFNRSFSGDLRVTYFLHSGNDISVSGPGDVYANINYKPAQRWTLTAGVKIPLTDGGKFYDSTIPLPMDYQSSLGTFDLITGIGYKASTWQLVVAYQQPLNQNANLFEPGLWPANSPLREFPASFGFRRKPDIMLRLSVPFEVHEKLIITPSLLPIFHLAEDEYDDANDNLQPYIGSDGLTINANVFFDILLSLQSKLTVSAGFPLLVRDVRPDGLTRSFVFGVDYSYSF